jgi:hypothetical protein
MEIPYFWSERKRGQNNECHIEKSIQMSISYCKSGVFEGDTVSSNHKAGVG